MEFIYKFLNEILIASGGLAVLGKWLISYLKKVKYKKYITGLLNVEKLYDLIQKSRKDLKCCRILIFKSTNGGGVPKLDCQVYSTVVHEVYGERCNPIKDSWQGRRVDSYYHKLLCQIVKNKKVILTADDMEGQIKRVYESNKQKLAYVFSIKELEDKFIYVSFVFHEDKITIQQEAIIDYTVNELRNMYDQAFGK